MEEKQYKTQDDRVYSITQIMIGTLFGGPIASTYFIYKNFMLFNEKKKAQYTIFLTIPILCIIIYFVYFLEIKKSIHTRLVPIIYTIIAGKISQYFQENNINEILQSNGKKEKWIKFTFTTVILLLLSIIILYPFIWLIFE